MAGSLILCEEGMAALDGGEAQCNMDVGHSCPGRSGYRNTLKFHYAIFVHSNIGQIIIITKINATIRYRHMFIHFMLLNLIYFMMLRIKED
jgi:hypothetical protein